MIECVACVIGGAKSNFKPIAGGLVEERRCEECQAVTRWRECDVRDRFSLFFIDLVDTTQRRLVCSECGHDIELPETRKTQPIAKATRSTPVPSATPPRRQVSEREADRMLAALKQKMRKP